MLSTNITNITNMLNLPFVLGLVAPGADPPRRTILRRILLYAAALALVAVIGVLDVLTGVEASFSIFYLVPVSLVAWHSGRLGGILLSMVAGGVWLAAELFYHQYSHQAIAGWNASVRVGFFILVALGLARIRGLLEAERLQARMDALTGLPNSRHLFELLDREIERSRRNGRPLTVAYLDLDGFKRVNDRWGHLKGDGVLQEAARVLSDSVRLNDVVARIGGDEFAILLPETGLQEARIALGRAQQAFSLLMTQTRWPVTASIGAATFLSMPRTAQEFVQQADALMYQAKQRGKNQICSEAFEP